jgi:hypothetical protein
MKKILIIVAVAGLAMVACKKDRECSCKTYSTLNGANATSFDQKYTMKDVSRRTAFNACIHSKESYTTSVYTGSTVTTGTVDVDYNCELK